MLIEKAGENPFMIYAIAVMTGMGILVKLAIRMITGRLVKEAQNIHQSEHPLMKLIKAKYEHANLMTERVQNVEAFVDKYLYEYRVMGIKYCSLQSVDLKCAGAVFGVGLLGGALFYLTGEAKEQALFTIVSGAACGIILFLLHVFADDARRVQAVRIYIVDYLQNFCSHRYAKQEMKVEKEEIEPVKEKKEEKPASEMRIREILEEFLA